MQASLEEDDKGIASLAPLSQRLQQVAYGYQCTRGVQELAPAAAEAPAEHHVGLMQLEAPLQNLDMWALLPMRKPLLTKRSRRCRLASTKESGAAKSGSLARREGSLGKKLDFQDQSRASGLSLGQPGSASSTASIKGCGKVVVKPQINPCSNPPFQKNNA